MSLPHNTLIRLCIAVLIGWLALAAASATAAPARIALVLGNSEYYNLPATPACTASMRRVSESLKGLDYQVVEQADTTSGGIAAAMGQFQHAVESAPGASAIAYFCGYAAALEERLFVLPVSANLIRPSDVRTQGILAKAFLDLMARGHTSRALVLMDLTSTAPLSQLALDTLAQSAMDNGTGMVATVGPLGMDTPSSLATALADGLTAPQVETRGLLTGIEQQLTKDKTTQLVALHLPLRSLELAEEGPREPAAFPKPPPASPPEVVQPAVATSQPSMLSPRTQSILPDEGAMSAEQRRMVQIGLARFGYYGGRIDSIIGPETRAAIRQFQGEIGADVTGVITGEQASRLLKIP